MTWDYKKFPVGHFDFIWASPECKVYSILQNTWFKTGKRGDKGKWEDAEHLQRVREEHGQFSKRALEIIDYFKPKVVHRKPLGECYERPNTFYRPPKL